MSRLEPLRTSLLVCVCGGAMVSGCAVSNPFATAAVDPGSPVAAEVSAKARASNVYPTFASIPPVPSDVRALPAFGRAANELEAAGAELIAETAPGTWTLTGTEAFAGRARDIAGPGITGPESTTAATEAFAKAQRARATPPPPPR
ncbi:MAG: hypothetical protein KA085_16530 [Phenylobacterium sp.]|uniref:hypothetical protein n=1 Tax=Phenylobacterium sp. TaxID=1871053 RepID=UPI001B7CC1B6|nr:hypothetical protein [Phenylobacterium sp.]MBP7817728.1 hypothetical protein [Phenylobacterium sp.]MBP9231510.1 hypothetical protein [Phenylobacterium sp.]MBP9755254.1 hypothetical protein [Phenylobacterium sp.]